MKLEAANEATKVVGETLASVTTKDHIASEITKVNVVDITHEINQIKDFASCPDLTESGKALVKKLLNIP